MGHDKVIFALVVFAYLSACFILALAESKNKNQKRFGDEFAAAICMMPIVLPIICLAVILAPFEIFSFWLEQRNRKNGKS